MLKSYILKRISHRTCNLFIKQNIASCRSVSVVNVKYNSSLQHRHLSVSSKVANYWDYSEEYGPNNWQKLWKLDKRQSPIDILTKLAKYNETLGEYNVDYTPVHFRSINNGVNVSTVPSDGGKEICLTGGALDRKYRLREFHFHWGDENTCGCEHTINGHRYGAELHLVHWNVDSYATEGEAIEGVDGLAVLGVFLDVHENYEVNECLEEVLDLFCSVLYKSQTNTSSSPFTPYDLLPSNKNDYFTYLGSLTTPPLFENVTWTVFKEPLKIHTSQLERFNELVAVEENRKSEHFFKDMFTRSKSYIPQPPTISNNFRPVQPLAGRTVYSSFKV